MPFPKEYGHPPDSDGSLKVYTVLENASLQSCTTRRDFHELTSARDQMDARSTFTTLLIRAVTGQKLNDLYDIQKCHLAHTYKHTSIAKRVTDVKIFRIWGPGKIRTYFVYLEGNRIALLKTCAKRANKLTEGQQKELEDMSRKILHCIEQNTFEAREK